MQQEQSKLSADLDRVVLDHLPKVTADLVTKRLAEAEKLEKDLIAANEKVKELKATNIKLQEDLAAAKALKLKATELDLKSKRLAEEEDKLRINLAVFEAQKEVLELRTELRVRKETDERLDKMYKIPFSNRILRESALVPVKQADSYVVNSVGMDDRGYGRSETAVLRGGEYLAPNNSEKEEA